MWEDIGNFLLQRSLNAIAALKMLWTRVAESCRNRFVRHLLSDVRVGLFLSSGLDSTALLGMIPEKQNVDAFTISFPDHPEYNESGNGRHRRGTLSGALPQL